MQTIRTANRQDAATLTQLALRSKAHWGYSDDFMAKCADELVVTQEECVSGLIKVTEENGILIGFYQLEDTPPDGKLGDLFVEPTYMGKGVGKRLFTEATKQARQLGFTRLLIASDPHAEDFYLHLGAKKVGSTPSGSIAGRELPLLEVRLKTE